MHGQPAFSVLRYVARNILRVRVYILCLQRINDSLPLDYQIWVCSVSAWLARINLVKNCLSTKSYPRPSFPSIPHRPRGFYTKRQHYTM